MNDETKTPPNGKISDEDAAAVLGSIMTSSMKKLVGQTDAQQIALMAVTAILVASPQTAEIDDKRMAAIIYALAGAKPENQHMVKLVAAYVSTLMGFAKKLPEALKAFDASEKKAAGGGPKKN